jgi:hypothetical protein
MQAAGRCDPPGHSAEPLPPPEVATGPAAANPEPDHHTSTGHDSGDHGGSCADDRSVDHTCVDHTASDPSGHDRSAIDDTTGCCCADHPVSGDDHDGTGCATPCGTGI